MFHLKLKKKNQKIVEEINPSRIKLNWKQQKPHPLIYTNFCHPHISFCLRNGCNSHDLFYVCCKYTKKIYITTDRQNFTKDTRILLKVETIYLKRLLNVKLLELPSCLLYSFAFICFIMLFNFRLREIKYRLPSCKKKIKIKKKTS